MPKQQTKIVQFMSMPIHDLKVAFCHHCLKSGLVNKDLSKKDRDLLMQEHWAKFWQELDNSCTVMPMRVKR